MNIKELLAPNRRHIWNLNDRNGTQIHNHLVYKQTLNHLAKLAKWLSCVGSTYPCSAFTVCSYHVTYVLQSESTPYSYLNVKELLARNRHHIWSLNCFDCLPFDCLSLWNLEAKLSIFGNLKQFFLKLNWCDLDFFFFFSGLWVIMVKK